VTWYEALAFTNWLRARTGHPFRLPTEAEWEWAAVGEEGRRYPFGMYAHDGISNNRETGIGRVTAVGIFPDDRTPEGLYDMGGNVREWCSSLAKPYPYDPMDGRENLRLPGPRILRGGFYDLPKRQQHAVNRVEQEPGIRLPVAGFRVALDAPRVTARLLPTGKEAEHA
jgi:formylglycine-generating enzyme required for sulfatase activity